MMPMVFALSVSERKERQLNCWRKKLVNLCQRRLQNGFIRFDGTGTFEWGVEAKRTIWESKGKEKEMVAGLSEAGKMGLVFNI